LTVSDLIVLTDNKGKPPLVQKQLRCRKDEMVIGLEDEVGGIVNDNSENSPITGRVVLVMQFSMRIWSVLNVEWNFRHLDSQQLNP
jgi:hypothetical protein